MTAVDKPFSAADQKAATLFAAGMVERLPQDNREALEAHITAVLVLFWGALWGTFGTEYARGFIEAQLRGMGSGEPEVFSVPRRH